MGFYVEPTHYKLKFEDSKYAGLEVTASALDIDTMAEMMSLSKYANADVRAAAANDATEVVDSMNKMFDTFANFLVSWNLVDKTGEPIPANRASIGKQEPGFIMVLIMNWMSAASSVDTPLVNGSNSGETSLMQSLTMEPLSPNQ